MTLPPRRGEHIADWGDRSKSAPFGGRMAVYVKNVRSGSIIH
jgi:hypothetical protein